jgi:PKHD-type hydroxylase
MQHIITPSAKTLAPYYWWENIFSESELDFLQKIAKDSTFRAKVGDNRDNSEIRRSNIYWMSKNQETAYVFEKLAYVVSQINLNYEFDLTGFSEDLQLTNYDGKEQGTYGWHQDFSHGPNRKLSLVLQLTDPNEYEGGNLEILRGANSEVVKKQRGLIAAFPSYTLHRVTPVTRGTRQSLVSWVTGPSFK